MHHTVDQHVVARHDACRIVDHPRSPIGRNGRVQITPQHVFRVDRSGRKTGRKPESRESYRQDSSVQEAFGAPDDRNGHRKSVRSPKTSGTKAGKKPATTVKASSKTSTPEKTAAKRASELPENWFEEWFGQRQPARNKKGPNRTPKRKNRD